MLDLESKCQCVLSCDYWLVVRVGFCGFTIVMFTLVGGNVEALTYTQNLIHIQTLKKTTKIIPLFTSKYF